MGLMDKSLESRRVFSATNKRMLDAVNAAAAAGDTALLKQIDIVMSVDAYEHLLQSGRYKSIKRKRVDRRKNDRRTKDRRK